MSLTLMISLTPRQSEVLQFIVRHQEAEGAPPTLREIASHFGFNSMNAAVAHVRALRKKGAVQGAPHKARGIKVVRSEKAEMPVFRIPIYGTIPAGAPEDQRQEALGWVAVGASWLGTKPSPDAFALMVKGDSMVGRHIVAGDMVILDPSLSPHPGDVVAAMIDEESTLKTFGIERGRPVLKAENPKYPKLFPARELAVQGVMIGLIRKRGSA